MFEDTTNQCISKLDTAMTYLANMPSDARSTFQTSNDYIISTARTRLEAWATHEGKIINWTNGTLNNASKLVNFDYKENNNVMIMLIVISMAGITSIGAYIYNNRKREKE